MEFINMNELQSELGAWGVPAHMEYDEMGDGWVLAVGNEDNLPDFVIHHGFKHNDVVYANPKNLVLEVRNTAIQRIATRELIVSQARMEWTLANKRVVLPLN